MAGYACFPINYAAHKLLSEQGDCSPLEDYGDITSGLEAIQQRVAGECAGGK